VDHDVVVFWLLLLLLIGVLSSGIVFVFLLYRIFFVLEKLAGISRSLRDELNQCKQTIEEGQRTILHRTVDNETKITQQAADIHTAIGDLMVLVMKYYDKYDNTPGDT
jgi:hypothetical protein